MRKTIVNALFLLSLSVGIISCETAKKEAPLDQQDAKNRIEQKNNDEYEHNDIAHAVYQCPMKCEADKTYEEPGSCPVCKMDLKAVETVGAKTFKEEEEPTE